MGDAADSAAGLAIVFVNRLLRYLTSIERAYFRVLDKLTRLQKERRAQEQAAAFERTWLDSLKETEQQTAEIKKQPNKSASFRKYANVPRLSRSQLRNAYRKASANAAELLCL